MSSAKGLLILEALAAAAICSIMAVAVTAAVMSAYHGRENRLQAAVEMDENYASAMEGERACIVTCAPTEEALP
ncbi:MAG: hypothetical protein LKE64_01645 [Solobacterium sp.]|nr:hypothetical protein [Solobacterium sp.]